jgi:hypothetical protein
MKMTGNAERLYSNYTAETTDLTNDIAGGDCLLLVAPDRDGGGAFPAAIQTVCQSLIFQLSVIKTYKLEEL